MKQRVIDRDVLVGVVISGGFGVGWAMWAASGLSGGAATVVRVSAVVVGAVIVASAVLLLRDATPAGSARTSDSGSMFRSSGYLVTAAAEVVALFGGNVLLGVTGHSDYVAAWVALVVGVHFIGFGRLFAPIFYRVGGAFILASVVGVIAGAAGGTRHAVEAPTGLIAAVALFAAGAWGLLASAPSGRRPTVR